MYTMIFLRLCGVAAQFPTYPRPLDLDEVRRARFSDPGEAAVAQSLLRMAETNHPDLAVAAALREALAQSGAPAAVAAAPAEIAAAQARVVELEDSLRRTRQRAAEVDALLHTLTSSRSWRLTGPIRQAAKLLRVNRR
jgi:hypothetical protein